MGNENNTSLVTSHQIGQTYPSNCYSYIVLSLLLLSLLLLLLLYLEMICPDGCCIFKNIVIFMGLAVREPTYCIYD